MGAIQLQSYLSPPPFREKEKWSAFRFITVQQTISCLCNFVDTATQLCNRSVDLMLIVCIEIAIKVAANGLALTTEGIDHSSDLRPLYMKNGLKRFT